MLLIPDGYPLYQWITLRRENEPDRVFELLGPDPDEPGSAIAYLECS